jgi:hypothetical protein
MSHNSKQHNRRGYYTRKHKRRIRSGLSPDIVAKVPMNLILNAILVEEGIRNAMLIQPQDYGNNDHTESPTINYLDELKAAFPGLIQTSNYETYQGVIISKRDYSGENIGLNKMGEILSYPCHAEFADLDRTLEHYTIRVDAYLTNGDMFDLIPNICQTKKHLHMFEDMAKKAETVLKTNEKYKFLKVDKVNVMVMEIIPTIKIINRLADNKQLTNSYLSEIYNILLNKGYSQNKVHKIMEIFNPNNAVHRGIMITLMVDFEYDMLSPFYSLTNYPEEYEMVKEITDEQCNKILELLEKTNTQT